MSAHKPFYNMFFLHSLLQGRPSLSRFDWTPGDWMFWDASATTWLHPLTSNMETADTQCRPVPSSSHTDIIFFIPMSLLFPPTTFKSSQTAWKWSPEDPPHPPYCSVHTALPSACSLVSGRSGWTVGVWPALCQGTSKCCGTAGGKSHQQRPLAVLHCYVWLCRAAGRVKVLSLTIGCFKVLGYFIGFLVST